MKNLTCSSVFALGLLCITKGEPKSVESSDLLVKVSQGSLQGKKVTSKKTGGEYYSFQGIPYAQPPVGYLRFKAPSEAPKWTGVRDATFERAICTQINDSGLLEGSEDCLYLNVYMSQLPSASGRSLLPVMVWIYGGSFMQGSGNAEVYGPDFLMGKGIVLVTLNYRLGVIGFLGLNNSRVSQNNGLKDQLAALKWVQANIAQFGGDKDQVTIFGESAGGGSVELQVLSPATKGLFHRAISQSGNAFDRWAYVEPSLATKRAFLLGKLLGFTSDDEDALITFLKTVTAEKLISYQTNALTDEDVIRGINIPFPATKETGKDIFLPESPLNIMKSRNYQHVPYITGFNSAEGKLFARGYLHNDSLWTALANNMEQFVPPELALPLGSPASLRLAAKIKKLYFGDETPTVRNMEGLVNLFSDTYIVNGVRRSSKLRLKTSSTSLYIYQFSYVGRLSLSELLNFGYTFRGAGHADDVGYIFNTHDVPLEKNSTEISMIHKMTNMWTNFAKTGNPAEGLNIEWNTVSSSKKLYLNINTEVSIQNFDELHSNRFAFWDEVFARIDD